MGGHYHPLQVLEIIDAHSVERVNLGIGNDANQTKDPPNRDRVEFGRTARTPEVRLPPAAAKASCAPGPSRTST